MLASDSMHGLEGQDSTDLQSMSLTCIAPSIGAHSVKSHDLSIGGLRNESSLLTWWLQYAKLSSLKGSE